MSFKYNNNEKKAVKAIIFIVSMMELLRQLIPHITPEKYSSYSNVIFAVTFAISVGIIYFGKERFFIFLFKYVPVMKDENITGEDWNIKISFKEDGKEKIRTGVVKIKHTINGVRLIGGQLIDINNKKVTMNNWFSESAEIIKFDNHAVLFYIYKIPSDNEKHKKIGFVYAIKKADADCYEGFFYDIRTSETEKESLRKGDVEIYLQKS